MPEIQFKIQWPDGSQELCYSPSLVVQDYLTAGEAYGLEDFVERSREALSIASDRVQKKYGFPCGRAIGQRQAIEAKAKSYRDLKEPSVLLLEFIS